MNQDRVQTVVTFLFDHKKTLFLCFKLYYQTKPISLNLSAFMQFLYHHDDILTPKDSDYCYKLCKLLCKVDLQGQLYYAITEKEDMARFFKANFAGKHPLYWENENRICPIEKTGPLPITILIQQQHHSLNCKLKFLKQFLSTPLSWLLFKSDHDCYCFSDGTLIADLPPDIEEFMASFSTQPALHYKGHEVISFINQIYTPNKMLFYWDIKADLSSLLPKQTIPIPNLKLRYETKILHPTLCFKYGSTLIESGFEESTIYDKQANRHHERLLDLEENYQKELMQQFEKNNLPFLLENPGDIAAFMDTVIPLLEQKGWFIDSNIDQFNVQKDPVDIDLNLSSDGQDWFYFDSACHVQGDAYSLQEIASLMVQNHGYINTKNGFVKLSNRTQQDLKTLKKMGALNKNKKYNKAEIMPLLHLSNVKGTNQNTKTVVEQVQSLQKPTYCTVSDGFKGELRDYQQYGLNWLYFLNQSQLGGVLADDMGLGKTIQTLALISSLEKTGPVLIVGPTNVVHNWANEIKMFLKKKKTVLFIGSQRESLIKRLSTADFIISSFGILKNDIDIFKAIPYQIFIIDEAQFIKNPKTQLSEAVKQITAGFKLALTGTPIENDLQDLWNLFDFCMPNYLGSKKEFDVLIRNQSLDLLKTRVKPFILRREKREVLAALPEKTEIIYKCPLTDAQQKLYQTVLSAAKKGIKTTSGKQDRLNVLTALLKLRQVCSHPGLLKEFKGDEK